MNVTTILLAHTLHCCLKMNYPTSPLNKDDRSYLCAVEHHRKSDSQYITQQLDRHMTAIDQNLLAEAYDYHSPNLVLPIHESIASFKNVQQRLIALPGFNRFVPYFHFTLHENAISDFANWVTVNGGKSKLFKY